MMHQLSRELMLVLQLPEPVMLPGLLLTSF